MKTIAELKEELAGGASQEDVLKEYFAKIDQHSHLNAFISTNKDAEGRKEGPLAGIPIAIKDLICTKGQKTTAASKILKNFIPPYTATLVERLQNAGAIVIGKTNLDEFAMGSSNENSAFGDVKNPWNTDHVPGGSSGGSAVAVAAGLAPASIGTDTGGSIRQPASFTGVVGLKPTYGRISRYGVIAFASSLDQAGPMTLSVEDAALLLEVMAGKDERDTTSSSKAVEEWSKNIDTNLTGLKVGLPKEYLGEGLDTEVRAELERTVALLVDRGAEIVDISLPMTKHAIASYYIVATSEASSNLARYEGIRYGERVDERDLDLLYRRSRGEGFGTEVKRRIMLGTYALSSGYYDAYYLKASQIRRLILEDFQKAFTSCDVLLTPVTTTPAFKRGEKKTDPLQMYLNDIYTTPASLAGLPGLSLPTGLSKNKLPIGMQLLAPHFAEQKLLNFAKAIEEDIGWKRQVPHGL